MIHHLRSCFLSLSGRAWFWPLALVAGVFATDVMQFLLNQVLGQSGVLEGNTLVVLYACDWELALSPLVYSLEGRFFVLPILT